MDEVPRRFFLRRLAMAMAVGASVSPAVLPMAAAASAPLSAYGQLPQLEDVTLSPDGSKAAFVRTEGDGRFLFIVRAGVQDAVGGARIGDSKLRRLQWMDEDNLLITVSSTGLPPFGFIGVEREWFQALTYNVPTRKLTGLNFDVRDTRTFNVLEGDPVVRTVDGKTVLFVPGWYVTDRIRPGLFEYQVGAGRMKLIARGSEQGTQWLMDSTGHIAAEFAYNDRQKVWEMKVNRGGHLAPVASGSASIDVPTVLGFDAAGDSIVVRFVENGDPVWKPLSLKDATWGLPLSEGAALRGQIIDRLSGRVIGGAKNFDSSDYVFFDPETQAHWNAVVRAFPNEKIDLVSHTDDFSQIVVRVFGAKDGYTYALFNWYSHKASGLGAPYLDVVPAVVRPVNYQAADGLIIRGYLTLPSGRGEKDLPLIVLPHGGPAAADVLGFDWWAQALAAQGYAVLQPNYRGSNTGYSAIAAGFGEWGRKMQSDLSDGVRHFARQGIIDPKRVCIVGASYGGYAALAGVSLESGVYRCAVAVAGISDIKRLLNWTDSRMGSKDNISERYWDRFMGVSGPNDIAVKDISPIEHVNAINVPVLLIHGRDDTVVPYEQSDVMADALRRAGKPVELVTLKHEDHWLSRSVTRQQMLEATVAFLRKHNPPE